MENNIMVDCEESIEPPQWLDRVIPFINQVLDKNNLTSWELSILFCNDEFIQNLNKEYRQIDAPTDVLSFEQGDYYTDDNDEEIFSAGDIIISLEYLKKNTEKFKVSANEELKRLLIHGILHLNGMDHGEFHVGSDGKIYDGDGNVSDSIENVENNEEFAMLSLQEELMKDFKDIKIINQ